MPSINRQTPGPLISRNDFGGTRLSPELGQFLMALMDSDNNESDARLLAAAYNAFDRAGRALGVDATELANALHVEKVVRLLDGLSEMVEDGRLKEADIPDDYQWLVNAMAEINAPLPPSAEGGDQTA